MTCGNMMEIIGLGFQVQILLHNKEIMDNKEYLLLISQIGGYGYDSNGNQGE